MRPPSTLVVERVMAALRVDLESLAVELLAVTSLGDQLTVEQVARRLGVARSTVYAHWREWGGYKLGPVEKAPIRFDRAALPAVAPRCGVRPSPTRHRPVRNTRKPRKRRDLVGDAPRFDRSLGGVS
jgi:transposase-like protein